MGVAPEGEVGPGAAMAIPTGGLLPARRRRGRDGRAHHRADARSRRGAARRLAPGRRRARSPARRRRPGDALVPAGRPLRAADLGLLAAAGVTRARRRTPARGWGSSPRATRWCPPRLAPSARARSATPARPRWPGWCGGRRGAVAARHRARRRGGARAGARRRRSPRTTWWWSPPAPRSARATSPRRSSARLGRGRLPRAGGAPGQADAAGRLRRRAAGRAARQPALRARRLPARRRAARARGSRA